MISRKKAKVNAVVLQILLYLQRQIEYDLGASHRVRQSPLD